MTSAAIDWTGKRRQPCPACNRGPRDGALGISERSDGSYIAHCFRCSAVYFSDERPSRQRQHAAPPRPAIQAPQKRETLSTYGLELWGACRPVSGPALAYLEARDCTIPPADGDLRWHPDLRHPGGYSGPALVALVTHAETRAALTLHFTWVRADGKKAEVDPPRWLLAGHRKAGGVIRLWPDEAVSTGLALAEGVETALSVARYFQPVWAAIDAGNLGTLPVLPGIEALTIAADHDPAGLKGADACADRWAAAGADVRVIAPRHERADWNDRRVTA